MEDDGRGDWASDWLPLSACPIRAQVRPPRGVLPTEGRVDLFPEKR
jgi:hypothetical protein